MTLAQRLKQLSLLSLCVFVVACSQGKPEGGGDGGTAQPGTISGTVTAPAGGNLQDTAVLACYNANCETPQSKRVEINEAVSSAEYTISDLAAGSYGVAAFKDINSDGVRNAGDYYGEVVGVTPPAQNVDIAMEVIPDGGGGDGDPNACTYVLNEDITIPSKLVNSPSDCDYRLEGYVGVSSTLVIEPGTVIVATQDSGLSIDGGQLIAVGTSNARIVFEGLNHVAGYWEGIRFYQGRESHIEYVDIKDAGQVCASYGCPDGGLIVSDVTLSLIHTTVSNSYVHGVVISGDVVLSNFANNRFYGNLWAGLYIDANLIGALDAASDYLGEGDPNGFPYVQTGPETLNEGATWPKINAPYRISGYLDVEYGTLTLEPGVQVVFGEEDWLNIDAGGALKAVGTASDPIIFTRAEPTGYWEGIRFWNSDSPANRLEYVEVSYGGAEDNLLPINGNIELKGDSSVSISHSLIAHSAAYGINCDDPEDDDFKLTLGPGNIFADNAWENVDPDCGLTSPLPGGDVSGTVTAPAGEEVAETAVFACDLETQRCSLGVLVQSDGRYTLPDIPGGRYVIDAWKDINDNGEIDAGDFYGCYSTAEPLCDEEVSPPAEGIDIQMSILTASSSTSFDEGWLEHRP